MEDRDNPILRDLLEKAAELPPAQRAGFLDGACGGDQKLRAEVDALLASLEQADGFLDNPTFKRDGTGPAAAPTADASAVERAGSRVGRYKLLQLIGEGGFGTVFMAEQEHPVRRRVAFKIIKPGMDSAAVIARFEAERQALAMMEHPNIARVYDAGTTDAGRPYFVMELVQGIPITRYCDSKRLTPRQRMELFIPVCRAIQHAHQKGIIHRDLKPSNVLVMTCDAQPVPKVIDFGVAKALHQRLTERTLFTQFGHAIGTPEYMSPEQADMDVVGADTRSDVYSLGVLLYELLTGFTPLDGKTLREAGYARMLQLIREQEPPRPSTRLASSGEALASISAERGTASAELTRLTRGDLDWIVMKCLEKDRGRRYASADGLARDIERYLSDEPVEASPPSRAHKFRRFVRKHRVPLAVSAAFVAVLLAATTFSTSQAVRATRARTAAEAEKQRADEQAAVAQAVNDFLNHDLLSQVSAYRQDATAATPVADLTVREALDRAAMQIRDRFTGQPRVEAEIRRTIGQAYQDLNAFDKAGPQFEAALELSRQAARADEADSLPALRSLADFRRLQGRLPDAELLDNQALDICRKQWGNDNTKTLDVQLHLAYVYLIQHRPSEAEPLIQHAVERSKALGPDHPDTIKSLGGLANLLGERRDYARAEPLLRQVLESKRRILGETHPETLKAKNYLADNLALQGQYASAEPLFVEAAKGLRQELGERSGDAMVAEYSLGCCYLDTGQLNKAEPPLCVVSGLVLEGKGDKLAGKLPLAWVNALITCYQRMGEWDKAAEWGRRLFEVQKPQLTTQIAEKTEALKRDSENRSLLRERGDLYGRLGRFREAASDYARVLDRGPEDYDAWWPGLSLLLQSGDMDGYRQRRTQALRKFANSNGVDAHRIVKGCVLIHLEGEESQAALRLADRALPPAFKDPWAFATKGMAEYRCGHYEQAITWLSRDNGSDGDNWREIENGFFLAMGYWKLNEPDQARSALAHAADLMDVRLPKPGERDLETMTQDWILCHVVRREAEEMIGKPTTVPAAADGPATKPVSSQ